MSPNVQAHPTFEDIKDRWLSGGEEALIHMPAEWWRELGAIGSFSDAVAQVRALYEAGAHDVSLLPAPEVGVARDQIDDIVRLVSAVR